MAAADAASSAGASGSSVYAVSEEKTNGTRLARLLVDGGTQVLRKVLHSVHPPATLHHVLDNNLPKLQSLKSRRVIFDDQWEKLFPTSGDPPDSKTFDIILLHLLLREICHLTAPTIGWHKMPADGDVSREANIVRIKCFRNELCHSVSTGIPNGEFEDKWSKISTSLESLEASVYRKKIQDLKDDPIDHDTRRAVAEQVEQWRRVEQHDESDDATSNLCSFLPDKVPEKLMFGREKEIKEVKEIVQTGTVPVVLITGGPGFGKTTVANEVAHELAKPENERTVLFCSLLTQRSFNEVATEMIHSCGTIHTKAPENPEQWLKDWSKQIQTQVTFVLDNADGVLESKRKLRLFLNILRAVRMLSKQKVTFVITTRKTFKDPNLQLREVRLNPVLADEAKRILVSRIYDHDMRNKLCKTERLVELCGGIPLALCIVGSLLSDFTEEKLIKHLEEQPLTVLKDDETSVENAIKTSFDLLTQAEHKEAFVLLSLLPGSFKSDAAEAVLEACSIPGTLPGSILRSLKNRSLLEQPSPRMYQMHPLIQALAKKLGDAEYPHLVAAGDKLACAHFMSRLAENANRYWSKNTCRESVEAFNADRHNFEYFLQIYAQGREKKDCDIMESCKTFLDDFPQKCMYLEMCVLPRFYISILERLLLETFDSESQPVHRVELLCLLGHEVRKVGDTAKYNAYTEEARKLYEEKGTDFETNPLSEVIYLHSYARFVSESKVSDEPKNVFQKSLQICEEKLPEHPERAATLLFAGRLDKRRKEKSEADRKMKLAWQLFNKCLGEHFMTAQCLKDFADLLFFFGNNTELDRALSYYQKALKMMKKLGMEGHKESILTLKNYGICHKKKGNFEEARNLLEEAERVAERDLDEDHKWKAIVKIDQALLYEEEGKIDQMAIAMKEGLQMCYRLGQTVQQLGNKHLIRKTLNRYPEFFPKEQYPR
ncbi:uncharacterized protein LOC110067658 [Orbicella faveolata]|uniref:uncharacterized protein LOC110067658 n=1 Tax=Orbicella faveolata TaxID=48498 RepID=UPI0009E4A09B|nr:uncharacterized protein LOC110067658 [Orbicella faveolata]